MANAGTESASSRQERLMALMKRKDDMEAEILAITEELNSALPDGKPGVGLKGKLVDNEGFPRNDLDIMRITAQRNRHAVLNTDLADLMREIECELHALHAEAPKPEQSSSVNDNYDDPFLRINSCQEGSPAFEAGLREGDAITKLGKLKAGEFERDGFTSVQTQIVENKPVRIYYMRDGQRKTATLIPKKWDGKGLVGCHLVKYSN